jgi:hypothetical protein
MHYHELGLGTATDESHYSVAHSPSGNAGAYGFDFAGVLESRDIRGPSVRRRILAASLNQVGTVQSGRMHSHPDVTGANLRLGHLANRDYLRAPCTLIDHCTHRLLAVGFWLLALRMKTDVARR